MEGADNEETLEEGGEVSSRAATSHPGKYEKLKTTIEVKLALKIFSENKSNVPKLSRSQGESGQCGDRYQRFPKVIQVNIYI